MALLTCRDLSFAYEGKNVVTDLCFSVAKGDYLCILGENGAGKSTLIKGLLHLKKPSAGQILLGEGLSPREIGYLPQETAIQKDFPASVFEVTLSGRLNRQGLRPFYTSQDKRAALENLERLGALKLRNKCYRELSGGQRQRVLLARALTAAGRLLLLDEPVTGLDPLASRELYRLIQDIHQDLGVAVVMVSHDVASAVRYASHILHLDNRQLFFGTTADYLESETGRRFAGSKAEALEESIRPAQEGGCGQ